LKDSDYGYSDGRREVRDSGVVSDIEVRGCEPFCNVVEILVVDGSRPGLFGADAESCGKRESLGEFGKVRPVLFRAAGVGMDGDESMVFAWNIDGWNCSVGSADLPHVVVDRVDTGNIWQRVKEAHWIICNSFAELGTIRAVPGHNFIEGFQGFEPRREGIDAGSDDGTHPIGKANEGHIRAGGPYLRVFGFQRLKGGQRYYAVADRAGANQQALQLRISRGILISIESGRRQARSSHAW
jgi:hypothetical protein